MRALCFDIGGTFIKYGVLDNGNILKKGSFPTDYKLGNEDITNRIINVSKGLIEEFPGITGVGVSCAGSIDFENGIMVTPPTDIPEFGGWNFKKIFWDNFGLKCAADNDVNTFAKAECSAGSGKNYSNYVVMTIGTGIGGAIVNNNDIWRGRNYNAGEVGRMIFNESRYEQLGSMTALLNIARRNNLIVKDGKEFFDLVDSKNEVAMSVAHEWYTNIARGIANLVYILNPEAIIIGGGVSARPDFFDQLIKYSNDILAEGFKNTVNIKSAKFQNDGGIIGAYYNIVEVLKK